MARRFLWGLRLFHGGFEAQRLFLCIKRSHFARLMRGGEGFTVFLRGLSGTGAEGILGLVCGCKGPGLGLEREAVLMR